MTQRFIVLNTNPHTTPHFWKVAHIKFIGTFMECEQYWQENSGFLWNYKFILDNDKVERLNRSDDCKEGTNT